MMRFFSQNRKTLLALVLFVSMIAFAILGAWPLYQNIVEKRDRLQALGADREYRVRQIARLPELRTQYDRILKDEGSLDILLTEEKVVDFIKTLEALARDNNVEIKIASNDTPLVEKKKSDDDEKKSAPKKETKLVDALTYPGYLRLSITVTGDYEDSVNFLAQMENLPTALDVIGVKMHENTKKNEENAPQSGNPNPFLLVPGGDSALVDTAPEEAAVSSGELETVLDTVVYVDKK
jgi:hypothetical protein